MRWFQGGIAQAVATSKKQNAIFVVFIQGEDNASQRLSDVINSQEVSSRLEGEHFVAVCLQSGSETFNQFSQIYRSPAVPSLYFIGKNGTPIEIVTEAPDSSSLLEKISSVESTHYGTGKDTAASVSQASETSSSSVNALPSSNAGPSNQEDQNNDPSDVGTLEERVERAKERLQEKRLQKQLQEEQEIREKELKRRQEGKNVQELKRWQQDQELKQLREERQRERRLEQEARQRVLEQIAQDRANRSAKNAETSPAVTQTHTASAAFTSNFNEARIQFRLPDGSTHTHIFSPDTTLSEVRHYLVSNVTLPFQEFSLATMFPRREFTLADNGATLRDLQLVPSSVVLIIAASNSTVTRSGGTGILGMLQLALMTLTYPIIRIFTFVRSLVFGTGANGQAGNSPQPTESQSHQTSNDKRTHRRHTYRRTGNSNVHRLHQNSSSSDEDNNTWNGNSTQQM